MWKLYILYGCQGLLKWHIDSCRLWKKPSRVTSLPAWSLQIRVVNECEQKVVDCWHVSKSTKSIFTSTTCLWLIRDALDSVSQKTGRKRVACVTPEHVTTTIAASPLIPLHCLHSTCPLDLPNRNQLIPVLTVLCHILRSREIKRHKRQVRMRVLVRSGILLGVTDIVRYQSHHWLYWGISFVIEKIKVWSDDKSQERQWKWKAGFTKWMIPSVGVNVKFQPDSATPELEQSCTDVFTLLSCFRYTSVQFFWFWLFSQISDCLTKFSNWGTGKMYWRTRNPKFPLPVDLCGTSMVCPTQDQNDVWKTRCDVGYVRNKIFTFDSRGWRSSCFGSPLRRRCVEVVAWTETARPSCLPRLNGEFFSRNRLPAEHAQNVCDPFRTQTSDSTQELCFRVEPFDTWLRSGAPTQRNQTKIKTSPLAACEQRWLGFVLLRFLCAFLSLLKKLLFQYRQRFVEHICASVQMCKMCKISEHESAVYNSAIIQPVVGARIVVDMVSSHIAKRIPVQSHNSFLDQKSRKVIVWFYRNPFCTVWEPCLRLQNFSPERRSLQSQTLRRATWRCDVRVRR